MKSRSVNLWTLLVFKTVWAMLRPVLFHKNFRIKLLTQKKSVRILNELVLNLYINLGRNNMSIILNLPIHKHWVSCSLFGSSLIFIIVLHNFQHINLAHILSDLYLSASCFCTTINGISFCLLMLLQTLNFTFYCKIL